MSASRRTTAIEPDDEAYCRNLLRKHDRDRFLSDLFAPEELRPLLFAVHAFALETSQLPARVSEPMLGELRLQWWRDTIERIVAEARIGNPVVDALGGALRAGAVTSEDVNALLDAREAELRGEATLTLASLEDHLARARGIPVAQAARILSPGVAADEGARHAGIAIGLAGMLARLADVHTPDASQALLPADLLEVHGLGFVDSSTEVVRIRPVVADIAATARHHLDQARMQSSNLARDVLPAFLPLATVAPDLTRIESAPFAGDCGPLRRQFAIYRAARRGRV